MTGQGTGNEVEIPLTAEDFDVEDYSQQKCDWNYIKAEVK